MFWDLFDFFDFPVFFVQEIWFRFESTDFLVTSTDCGFSRINSVMISVRKVHWAKDGWTQSIAGAMLKVELSTRDDGIKKIRVRLKGKHENLKVSSCQEKDTPSQGSTGAAFTRDKAVRSTVWSCTESNANCKDAAFFSG